MVTDKKTLPKSRLALTITATAEQYRDAFETELAEAGKGVQVEGFRKGKAPRAKLIDRLGRPRLEAGALDRVIADAYYAAVRDEQVIPVGQPAIDVEKFEVPADTAAPETSVVTFKAEVDVLPEVKIDGYKKIKVKKLPAPEVSEEEFDKVIDYLRKQQSALVPAVEGDTLENGMWAEIGYEGSVDGVKRADMKNEHHPLVVGEGQLIPGFEDAMIGMQQGETRTFTVTFPAEYHASELAGKDAEFTATVHEMKRVELPPLEDAFAKQFGHDSYAELEKAIRENLLEEKKHDQVHEQEEEVLEQLLKVAKYELPESLIEREVERMFGESVARLEQMKLGLDTYLAQIGKTAEQLRSEMREQAEKNVRIGLALGAFMREEGIPDGDHAAHEAVHRLVEMATA